MPESTNTYTNPYSNASASTNSPDINPKSLVPAVRAIANAEQAGALAKQLEGESREANQKNARIMAKYNAEKPFRGAELEAEGLGWKSNFSTKPLALLIDKVAPRFTTALHRAKFLTSSKLPEHILGADKKTELFRSEVTKTIRARKGWKNLTGEISQENALFGFTNVGWTDEYSWFPTHYRQDRFFIPTGTKQDVDSCQVVVVRDDFLLHQLFQKITDRDAAVAAGWNIENTVEAINAAMPEDKRSRYSDNSRVYEDLIRESSLSSSLSSTAKTVCVYSIMVIEVTGKVSHFMVEGTNWKELFTRLDRFESMSDCSSFFSFQQGNGTMHGSKGIGREIYSMAGVLDRSRNEVVDRLQLSGKLLLQCDEKQMKRFRMSVIGNAILIGTAYTTQTQQIEANVEPFFALDNYLTALLDQIAGATSPKQLEGERVTKAQIDLFAAREEEKRDAIIERFLIQCADMISTMQKRLCSPQSNEPDAQEMRNRLLESMSEEELQYLAHQPAVSTVADFTELERQQVIIVCDQAKGNPLYNQRETERRKLTATVGAEFAEAVLLPEGDPTVVAEQTRQQMLENLLLLTAQPVPVSPRDNFQVHLDALLTVIQQTAKELISNPGAMPIMQAMVAHAKGHLDAAAAMGATPAELSEYSQAIAEAEKVVAELAAPSPNAPVGSPMPVDPAAVPV